MNVLVKYTDGMYGSISVKWHPEFRTDDGKTLPCGLWTTEDDFFRHLNRVNAERAKMGVAERALSSPRECCGLLECAEADFKVYPSTPDGAPWKHAAAVKDVQYKYDDLYWDRH